MPEYNDCLDNHGLEYAWSKYFIHIRVCVMASCMAYSAVYPVFSHRFINTHYASYTILYIIHYRIALIKSPERLIKIHLREGII